MRWTFFITPPNLCFSGPEVQLSAKVVNFMQIDLGDTATRTIDLVNNSDIDAVYQVLLKEQKKKKKKKKIYLGKFIRKHVGAIEFQYVIFKCTGN